MAKFAVLAIGSELTSGDLINTHASWISKQMASLGFGCSGHAVVDDQRQDILEAIEHLLQRSQILFLTGGLGPTEDDLTRDCVAEFLGLELEQDQGALARITGKIMTRGLPVIEGHIRQSFFPKGAEILENSTGTADGFLVKTQKNSKTIISLPGPPRELQAIWKNLFDHQLVEMAPADSERVVVVKSHYLRLPESVAAQKFEPIFESTRLSIAFRASFPILEVKVIGLKKDFTAYSEAFDAFMGMQKSFDEYRIDDPETLKSSLVQSLAKLSDLRCDLIRESSGLLGPLIEGLWEWTQDLRKTDRPFLFSNSSPEATLKEFRNRLGLHVDGQQIELSLTTELHTAPYRISFRADLHPAVLKFKILEALEEWLQS